MRSRRLLRWWRASLGIPLAIVLGILTGPVSAQQPDLDPKAIEALIKALENDAERQALVAQLKTLAGAQRALEPEPAPVPVLVETLGARFMERLSDGIGRVASRIDAAAGSLATIPDWLAAAAEASADRSVRERWAAIAFKLVTVLGLAGSGQFVVYRLLAGARRRLSTPGPGWVRRVLAGMGRMIVDAAPMMVFTAIAFASLTLVKAQPVTHYAALALINAHILVGLVLVATRFLLRPEAAALRPLPITDRTAAALYRDLRVFVASALYGYFAIEAAALLGIQPAVHQVALHLFGLSIAVILSFGILRQRRAFSAWLEARSATGDEGQVVRLLRVGAGGLWHLIAIGVVALGYLAWAFEIEGAFAFLIRATALTLAILVGLRLATGGLARLLGEGASMAPRAAIGARPYGWLDRYRPIVRRIVQGAIYVGAALLLLEAWGFGAVGWLQSDTGRYLLARLVVVGLVVAVAVVVWEITVRVIAGYLERRDSSGRLVMESARTRTLLGLLRTVTRVVLMVLVVLTVLSEFGIQIGALLAGAGVIGLAVGFGAQSLVKDVSTGAFILIEDSIAVGDVVNVAGRGGVVESISIRSVRLRDLDGTVHVIPFGEVTAVQNMTKDYGFAVIEIGVGYRQDFDEVIRVLKEVGAGMRDDPTYGPWILEPLDVLGVDQLGSSSVVVKARLKTRPLKQWVVRREFLGRAKRAFDAQGIEIPFSTHTVYLAADQKGQPGPTRIRTAPARGAGPPESTS